MNFGSDFDQSVYHAPQQSRKSWDRHSLPCRVANSARVCEGSWMQRMTLGGLDLAIIDPHERDTRYIYDEVFVSQIYDHPEMRIPQHPVVMDVGANIGLYCLWAHRRYQPRD